MSTDLPPAGWYPNPDATGGLRWWSGVGWTEYTRGAPAAAPPEVPTDAPAPEQAAPETWQTQQLAGPEPTTQVPEPAAPDAWQTQQLAGPEPTTQVPEPAAQPVADQWAQQQPSDNPWAQPQPAWNQPAYAPYQPVAKQPLTPSRMRPLSGMFSDIGRIVRRGWLPILGISVAIWAAVSAIYVAAVMATVDLTALQRGVDLIGAQAENNPETGLAATDPEISAAFRDAFAALSPSGWALLLTALTVLLLVASAIQTAAVNRVGIDAAAGLPVSWGAGWRAGFTAGWRLLGYYILLSLVIGLLWTAAAALVVGLWALNPAIGVIAGILGFLVLIAVSVWLTGRLIPVIVQVVLGRKAISWSWRHTKGKFWAVLGRYILWSLAAGVIVNVIVTVISIPVSLLFLGTTASTSSTTQLGASLVLSLITLPMSMALSAVTFVGVVPIWRDLTDDPQYRAIGEDGLPIAVR